MFEGVLKKMITEAERPIRYYLQLNTDFLMMNELIGKKISIEFSHFQCLNCSKNEPLFRQGFCKRCFFEIPQAADWIMHPELSKAHLDLEDRDLAYEKQMQLQPHIVYLANSSDVKVGVTRKSQIPTRWIDQGAHQALIVAELPNRYLAGITEVALKNYVSDKTNWRKMVTNTITNANLQQVKKTLAQHLPNEVKDFYSDSHQEYHIEFPVIKYPEKPISLNLLKTPYYEGILTGIKGQYLLFEDNTIFNIRSNEGVVVRLKM